MNEDRLAEQISKAQRASVLRNDEAFNEAVETVKQQIRDRWEMSKDPNERELCWVAINLTERIKQAILQTVANGRMSQRELDDLVSGKKRQHFGVV